VPFPDSISCVEFVCPVNFPADYETSTCENKNNGDFCLVSCPEGQGFEPASSVFKCRGGFLGTLPTCAKRACLVDSRPAGAGVDSSDCDGKVAGETCNSVCAAGYEGQSTQVSCGNDGVFAGEAPVCSLAMCSVPAFLGALAHTCDDTYYTQGCTASCAAGFEGPPEELLCTVDTAVLDGGVALDGEAPVCEGVDCSFNLPWGDGLDSSSCSGVATSETCTLACQGGYEPVDDAGATLSCAADGAFSDTSYACRRGSCPLPAALSAPELDHGCDDLVMGQGCIVDCAEGYDRTGAFLSLTCMFSDNAMQLVDPAAQGATAYEVACTGRECIFGVPNILGLQHDCDGKTTGETCTVSAINTYQYLDGSAATTLQCGADGGLFGPLPSVEPKSCPVPTFGTGVGTNCGASKAVGESCWAYCEAGFQTALFELTCGAQFGAMVLLTADNVAADATSVACTPEARRLNSPGQLDVPLESGGASRRLSTCDSNLAAAGLGATQISSDCLGKEGGEVCIAECASGYARSGEPSMYTCLTSGTYQGSVGFQCAPIACEYSFPTGVGVTHTCAGVAYGSSCTSSCTSGYNYASGSGQQTHECGVDKSFGGTSPTCEPKACTTTQFGSTFKASSCDGKTFGQSCVVGCADGWTLQGQAQVFECQASGSFTGTDPTCEPNVCGAAAVPPATSDIAVAAKCKTITTGQTCEAACAPGYQGDTATLTCTALGSITGTLPTCSRSSCNANAVTWSASVSHGCSGLLVADTCTVGCADGYALPSGSRPESWTCGWSSALSDVVPQGTVPTCEALECTTNVPVGSLLEHSCGGKTTGQSCSAECKAGYSGTAQTYTCLSTRAFDGTLPTCTPLVCPARDELDVVQTGCDNLKFGETCHAGCGEGFSGSSLATWTCALNTDGTTVSLQGSNPECTPKECFEGLPVGEAYGNDCAGTTTTGTCSVRCVTGNLKVPPQEWTCLRTGVLNGSYPDCDAKETTTTTTSMTSTTTVTSTSTSKTSTTTTKSSTSTSTTISITMTSTSTTSSLTSTTTATTTSTTVTTTVTTKTTSTSSTATATSTSTTSRTTTSTVTTTVTATRTVTTTATATATATSTSTATRTVTSTATTTLTGTTTSTTSPTTTTTTSNATNTTGPSVEVRTTAEVVMSDEGVAVIQQSPQTFKDNFCKGIAGDMAQTGADGVGCAIENLQITDVRRLLLSAAEATSKDRFRRLSAASRRLSASVTFDVVLSVPEASAGASNFTGGNVHAILSNSMQDTLVGAIVSAATDLGVTVPDLASLAVVQEIAAPVVRTVTPGETTNTTTTVTSTATSTTNITTTVTIPDLSELGPATNTASSVIFGIVILVLAIIFGFCLFLKCYFNVTTESVMNKYQNWRGKSTDNQGFTDPTGPTGDQGPTENQDDPVPEGPIIDVDIDAKGALGAEDEFQEGVGVITVGDEFQGGVGAIVIGDEEWAPDPLWHAAQATSYTDEMCVELESVQV